jgi:hypothetical protein
MGKRELDSDGSCERGNEQPSSIKDVEYLEWLSNCRHLKICSAPQRGCVVALNGRLDGVKPLLGEEYKS